MKRIYKLIFGDGKLYIGQTKLTLEKRLQNHKHSSVKLNYPIYKAWRELGQPKIELICEVEDSTAIEVEIENILKFNTLVPDGYNLFKGNLKPEYMNISHSESMTGEKHPFYGKKHTEESKAKIGLKNSLYERTESVKQMLRTMNTGKQFSEEHRTKMSAARKGVPKTEETKAKMSVAKLGRTWAVGENGRRVWSVK